jgi:UDP-N-acetylmuramoyl-L-alanyl-D-glutamate--2,6-diaminopimelate ligase
MLERRNDWTWRELITSAGLTTRWEGPLNPRITSVAEDSRDVSAGACFVALRGTHVDGHAYVEQALKAGASAVIAEKSISLPETIPVLQLPSARGVAGRLSAVMHGIDHLQREGRLHLVGVTGTNGKSTFCYLLRAILNGAGQPAALIGTIEYDLLSRVVPASMTTPPATTLMRYLAEASTAGARHAVMEVSSHALDQGRCDGVRFSVGVFTNLTGDHLDYHQNMEAYLVAKKRLFDGLEPGASAIVNVDDPAGERIVRDCRASIRRYAIIPVERAASSADLQARILEMRPEGTRFILSDRTRGRNADVRIALIGRHNVQNCLAAAGAALALGLDLDDIARGLSSMTHVPGRLQAVVPEAIDDPARAGLPTVLVDYAHTDDALENVCSALRGLVRGRLIVLFGCGGDRDRTKRPRMARVARRYADRLVITSDNPRTEDPQTIIDDILAGLSSEQLDSTLVEPDRAEAIARAIREAAPGDLVLLAGKGHENYQIIGSQTFPFDDAKVAAQILAERLS